MRSRWRAHASPLRRALSAAALMLCAPALTSCTVFNSHAAAARQLLGGTERNYWCWSHEAGAGIPRPCVPKEANDAIWHCVHQVSDSGGALQSTERSREELIDCMHANGWFDYAGTIGRGVRPL